MSALQGHSPGRHTTLTRSRMIQFFLWILFDMYLQDFLPKQNCARTSQAFNVHMKKYWFQTWRHSDKLPRLVLQLINPWPQFRDALSCHLVDRISSATLLDLADLILLDKAVVSRRKGLSETTTTTQITYIALVTSWPSVIGHSSFCSSVCNKRNKANFFRLTCLGVYSGLR
jgi:hypothetical protein